MEIQEIEQDGILYLQIQNQYKYKSNFQILLYVLAIVIVIWILTVSCATCKSNLGFILLP